MRTATKLWILGLGALVALAACGKKDAAPAAGGEAAAPASTKAGGAAPAAAPALKADKGVDVANKVITLGALNDESGPAAVIGKPYAWGKRLVVERVNAGGSGLLPDGWTVKLEERDHGYNPQSSVQSYNDIKDDVLFVATSFGTPNTLPLRPMLDRDAMVAFPASLSSQMAEHARTPPVAPSYVVEAMRAMDFAIEQAGGADKVKAGIVYQKDDYGADGLKGWEDAAKAKGVALIKAQTVAPGQKDFTAVVSALKEEGATHVLLVTLPSATGPILGTAAQLGFGPLWLGCTPAWIDRFFDAKVIPPAVFANYHQVVGLPYWGEDVPGMKDFVAAYEKYAKGKVPPDSYILMSYLQGLLGLEAAKRAIEAGDITRAGYLKALQSIDAFDGGGIMQPVDLSKVPYVTGVKARVMRPVHAEKSWKVVADYRKPSTLP